MFFKTRTLSLEGAIFREYDVSPDGQRFPIGTLIGDTKAAPPTVILELDGVGKEVMKVFGVRRLDAALSRSLRITEARYSR